MNCESFMKCLDHYIDGELGSREENELLDHVAACKDCAQKFKEAKLLKNVLGGMDDNIVAPVSAQAA